MSAPSVVIQREEPYLTGLSWSRGFDQGEPRGEDQLQTPHPCSMGAPVELIKPLLVALTYEAKAPHPTDARLAWPPSGGVERPRLRAAISA